MRRAAWTCAALAAFIAAGTDTASAQTAPPAAVQPPGGQPFGAATTPAAELASDSAFRVCADPANAPMSTKDGTGFENRIAELFAAQLDRPLEYAWFPQSTGFIRKTLRAFTCDVVIGYAQGDQLVQNTNHYYSSAYVLVTLADGPLAGVDRIGDPRLQGRRVGVTEASPPVDHMLRAGLLKSATFYPLFVDRRVQDPAGDMLRDLHEGKIDVAILWGPIGGPAVKADKSLSMAPLLKEVGQPRMVYRITMGVRPADQAWKRRLNSLIRRNQAQIDTILRDAGVPLIDDEGTALKPPA